MFAVRLRGAWWKRAQVVFIGLRQTTNNNRANFSSIWNLMAVEGHIAKHFDRSAIEVLERRWHHWGSYAENVKQGTKFDH